MIHAALCLCQAYDIIDLDEDCPSANWARFNTSELTELRLTYASMDNYVHNLNQFTTVSALTFLAMTLQVRHRHATALVLTLHCTVYIYDLWDFALCSCCTPFIFSRSSTSSHGQSGLRGPTWRTSACCLRWSKLHLPCWGMLCTYVSVSVRSCKLPTRQLIAVSLGIDSATVAHVRCSYGSVIVELATFGDALATLLLCLFGNFDIALALGELYGFMGYFYYFTYSALKCYCCSVHVAAVLPTHQVAGQARTDCVCVRFGVFAAVGILFSLTHALTDCVCMRFGVFGAVIISFLLLMNMLLAILVDAYIKIKTVSDNADGVAVDLYRQVR